MPALRHAWLTFNPASRSARMSRRIEAIRSGLVRFRMQSLPGLCQLYDLHYDWIRFWGAGHLEGTAVTTDEWRGYSREGGRHGRVHRTVAHTGPGSTWA